MATRMTTLAYGDREDELFTYGNRPDAAIDPGDSGAHPRLEREREVSEVAAIEPFLPTPSVRRFEQIDDRPTLREVREERDVSAYDAEAVALPSILVALGIGAAVLVGLALVGIAAAWATSMSGFGFFVLSSAGVYLLAIGIASLLAAPTIRFQ